LSMKRLVHRLSKQPNATYVAISSAAPRASEPAHMMRWFESTLQSQSQLRTGANGNQFLISVSTKN